MARLNDMVRAILRFGWMDERLPNGEVIELMTFDGRTFLLTAPPESEGWVVRAWRHRPNQVGSNKQYRVAEVDIPFESWMKRIRSDGQLVDYFMHYLQLLKAKLMDPPKPPKGWRKFGRKSAPPCR